MIKKKLGQICDILNGFAFKSSNYVQEGIRIIRIANVQKGYIDDSQPAFYSIETAGLDKYMLEEGDLLLSLTGNVGRVAVLQKEMLPAALNQRVACLRVKNGQVSLKYLFHVLNSSKFESDCIMASNGVAQKNMSTEWLKEYEVAVYEPKGQENIVAKLDGILELIGKRKAQIQKLDDLVKSQFIEMFGDPGKNPKCWAVSRLSNHLEVIGGYAFKSDCFKNAGIPVLRIGNINSGSFQENNLVFWEYDEALEKYIMKPGDIVISLTGTVGKDDYANVCILGNDYERYYLNQRNAQLKLGASVNRLFIAQLLKFAEVKSRLTGISRGVRQANVANRDILNLSVPIPPIELQNEFARFIEQTDKSKLHSHLEVAA